MNKSMDVKLAEIRANRDSKAFIIADAKDADMAFGIASPGPASPEMYHMGQRYRSMEEFREKIREIVRQGAVDIMLMSASTNELLTIKERLFDNSHITPAARANDTTDIHVIQGGVYVSQPSRPFRTATIDHIQCGRVECKPGDRAMGADLGLYSVTFNNDLDRDIETLQRFKEFRLEAEAKGFRYFLEVFDPNAPQGLDAEKIPRFVNDHIVRALAGVTERGRPLFLKMVYHGPKAMEELAHYDSSLIIGVLGGSAGTTYDAFKLIAETQKYGGRVALFGRKINNAENQLAFIRFLRLIVDGAISPEEAVKAYHGVLQEMKITPNRSLDDDMKLTTPYMSYSGSSSVTVPVAVQSGGAPTAKPASTPATPGAAAAPSSQPRRGRELPDFDKMTPAEKIAWNQQERDRVFD